MGADYTGQAEAIEELRSLSDEAKKFLMHHFRNSLTVVICGIETNRLQDAKTAAHHMVEDLTRIGC
jgi:hypothetical protein